MAFEARKSKNNIFEKKLNLIAGRDPGHLRHRRAHPAAVRPLLRALRGRQRRRHGAAAAPHQPGRPVRRGPPQEGGGDA
eukprot:15951383-Heterocapsa_arctica.AAC.1